MKELFDEYSGPIIGVTVTVALLVIVGFLVSTDGPIKQQVMEMINGLFSRVGIASPSTTTPSEVQQTVQEGAALISALIS